MQGTFVNQGMQMDMYNGNSMAGDKYIDSNQGIQVLF